MPTQENLQKYIFTYKEKALNDVNVESQRLLDLANAADQKLGSHLITLSSAFIALIGAFTAGENIATNYIKGIVVAALVSLIISIVSGLKNVSDVQSFWEKAGWHIHAEGKIIVNDTPKDYNGLVGLRDKLEKHREKLPRQSNSRARKLQLGSFLAGIALIFILLIIIIF